jgi:hypothetical protein
MPVRACLGFPLLLCLAGLFSAAATAAGGPPWPEGMMPAVATLEPPAQDLQRTCFNSVQNLLLYKTKNHEASIPIDVDPRDLSVNYLATVVVTGIAGGVIADLVLDGGIFTIFGTVVGGLMGSEWYHRGGAAAIANILSHRNRRWEADIEYPEGRLPPGYTMAGR